MGQLTAIDSAVPAHIAAAFGEDKFHNEDLSGGVSIGYPIVSYKGKTWQVVEGGERLLITMDGSDDPAPSINCVIVRANPNLSKVYYPDGYEEGSTEKPTCHSNDSIAPALDAEKPQAKKCGACPHNQWGSRVTENGGRGKACSDARRLAIAPENDYSRAMLMRVPAASLRDLLGYAEQLKKRGVPYQALVTKIGFDHTVAYPKLTFKPQRWLTAEEVAEVQELYDSDTVMAITALNMPSVVDDQPETEAQDDFLPPGGPAEAAPKTTTKAKAKPSEVAEALGETPAPTAADKPKTSGFGGKKVAAAPEPEAEPETKATVLAEGALAELDSVLADFDD